MWAPDEALVYWIDIEGRRIHRTDPATGGTESISLPGRPGSFVRTNVIGRLLVALESGVVWLDWNSGVTAPWLDLEAPDARMRLNDGRTDQHGRYWVGSMDEQFEEGRRRGRLHRVDQDGSISVHKADIGIANGLAFDTERNRMYFPDTARDMVWRYEHDESSGDVSNETPFIDFSQYAGHPDGACVDIDGGYWVATVFGWSVMRFTPSGALDRIIKLPVQAPTMPAFGGADLSVLFVTSMGHPHAVAPDQSHAGAVLAIQAGISGHTQTVFGSR